MSGAVNYPLKHPVTVMLKGPDGAREETISAVTIRRPKGRDARIADRVAGVVSASLEMIAALTGHPIAVVDEMDKEDLDAISDVIEGFSPPGRATGETSSAT